MKKKLHIHSDCYYWGGSENMIGIFLQSNEILQNFDVTFSYRYSKDYQKGMLKWVNYFDKDKVYPLHFPISSVYKIGKKFKPAMFLKYPLMFVEIIALYKLFKRVKPNILHINNGGYFGALSCNSAAIAGRLAGISKITYMINSSAVKKWWEWPVNKLLQKSVTTWVTASQYLNDRIGFLGTNKVVIPNTIREDMRPINRDEVRNILGIEKNEVMFLCCGAFEKRKGFQNAIDAWSNKPNTSLWIVGQGEEQYVIENVDREICVVDRNKSYFKFIDDFSFINACDVLVVPSISDEDFPNVILIAMMYGKSIIGCALAGIPEQLKLLAGLLFMPTDLNRLQYFLKTISINDRRTLSKYALKKYDKEYSNDVVLKKWRELWNR